MMPNPKLGTVTKDIKDAIKNIKAGQIEFKTDKGWYCSCIYWQSKF